MKDEQEKGFDYERNMEEVGSIIESIEKGETPMSELTEKIARAAELLKLCKEKITHTDEEIRKILDGLES